MKFTLITLFGGLLVSLLFINNKVGEPNEIVEYTPPKTLTSQEVIQSTDLYKRVVKIEDTLALIKLYRNEENAQRFADITDREILP